MMPDIAGMLEHMSMVSALAAELEGLLLCQQSPVAHGTAPYLCLAPADKL